jgi:hypothetical protein
LGVVAIVVFGVVAVVNRSSPNPGSSPTPTGPAGIIPTIPTSGPTTPSPSPSPSGQAHLQINTSGGGALPITTQRQSDGSVNISGLDVQNTGTATGWLTIRVIGATLQNPNNALCTQTRAGGLRCQVVVGGPDFFYVLSYNGPSLTPDLVLKGLAGGTRTIRLAP